jgi:hypothetical protein
MKNEDLNVGEFVEKRLDQIINVGEWVGSKLGGAGRGAKNVIVAAGVLVVFGIAAFLWAFGKGLMKKGK